MKSLFLGIFAIILIGVGGLMYRNALEYPSRPGVCPLDVRMCPDGTSVARTGISCTFAECAPPNVTLVNAGISFAVPHGFTSTVPADETYIAVYEIPAEDMASTSSISIRTYALSEPGAALKTIQDTAITSESGTLAPITAYTSRVLGAHKFTIVSLERSSGTVRTAFYLVRSFDVLRFDAIDRGVTQIPSGEVDTLTLPAHAALLGMLRTLQLE